MQITRDTLTINVLPYITEEDFQKLYDNADEIPLKKSLFAMTCGEALAAMEEDWVERNILSEEYLMVALGRLKAYRSEIENLNKFMELNKAEETAEEKQAKKGIVWPTFGERVLLTVAEFFHLPSLDAAEDVPFSNYLVLYKSQSADAKFERNLNRAYNEKAKRKEGRR